MTDLPTTLTDGSGIFVWDVATNGSINDGTSDAFDTGFALSGYSNPNADPNEATPELGGRQLRLGTATIGSFDVTRSIYVPDTPGAGWARFMETVTNTSGSSQVYTLTIQTNLGSDSATSILDTSSGDTTFTTADTYLMTDDSVDGNGGAGSDTDPVVIQYFGNGRLLPDSVTAPNPNGFDTYTYNLTIGAGETVRFLSFGSQNLNRADADADLAFFKTADEALFFGMSEAELETVVNFGGPNLGTGGNDTLIGTFDGETIQGLGGNDLIFARDGTDIIYGGSGDDDIDAGNGSDKVVGGTGNDRIDGGAGNDSIYWNYGDGFDTIDGGADGDILYVGGDASVGNQISITANGSRVNVSWLNLGHYQLDIVNAETIEIHGGADADNVFGGVGLTGLASFVLYGEGGVDTLFGTDTVDTIYGGAGNDIIDAAGGDDIIHADGDNDRISGGAGFDTVIVDLVPATPGTISIDPNSSGRITLSTTALGTKQDIDTVERIELKGGAAGDIFVSSSTFGTSGLQELKIEGGGGGDTITTQSTYDTIKGGAGKDTINAGDGDDVIIIGEGDDLDDIDGGGNAFSGDTLDLSGIMAINGGVTIDTDLAPNANMTMSSLTGSVTGIETIIGSQGDDFIRYEQGAFEHLKVEGGEGSDTIEIEEGDNANGDLGDDTIFHKQTADPFFAGGTVDGGGGSDTLDFSLRTKSGISVGVGGSVATDITTGFIVTFVLDIDNIVGTDMDDSLFGDPSAAPGAFLDGRGGDDILFDVSPVGLTLIGGDGNDIYQVFSPFTVVSETGTGNDTVKSAYDFVLAPGMKVETLETDGSVGFANINLTGNERAQTINGNAGNNVLTGGGAGDVLNGGGGSDTASYAGSATGVNVQLQYNVAAGGEAAGDTLTSIENLDGSNQNDTLIGNPGANRLVGNSGNDVLKGLNGADQLLGGGGDDWLYVDSLDTQAHGGTGTDRLVVTNGNGVTNAVGAKSIEIATGNAGNDIFDGTGATEKLTLTGRGGNDVLTGGDGDDFLFGDSGADELRGGGGLDRLYVDENDTVIDGGAGDEDRVFVKQLASATTGVTIDMNASHVEIAYGNLNNDSFDGSGSTVALTLFGRQGQDTLIGGSANDRLYGDNNDAAAGDILNGGAGNDFLRGGVNGAGGFAERDQFVFNDDWGNDRIFDFANNGAEKIDFNTITGITQLSDLTITDGAGFALISYHDAVGGWDASVRVDGVMAAQLQNNDFIFV